MTRYADTEGIKDCFYRILEFRKWIDTNILFPQVPDSIVHDLIRKGLIEAENKLLIELSEKNELEYVVAIRKAIHG